MILDPLTHFPLIQTNPPNVLLFIQEEPDARDAVFSSPDKMVKVFKVCRQMAQVNSQIHQSVNQDL